MMRTRTNQPWLALSVIVLALALLAASLFLPRPTTQMSESESVASELERYLVWYYSEYEKMPVDLRHFDEYRQQVPSSNDWSKRVSQMHASGRLRVTISDSDGKVLIDYRLDGHPGRVELNSPD